MHCYACDLTLSNPAAAHDVSTGRYYCGECFSWTIDEQLRIAGKDFLGDLEDLILSEDASEPVMEPLVIKEEEENEYF